MTDQEKKWREGAEKAFYSTFGLYVRHNLNDFIEGYLAGRQAGAKEIEGLKEEVKKLELEAIKNYYPY